VSYWDLLKVLPFYEGHGVIVVHGKEALIEDRRSQVPTTVKHALGTWEV
jgi:hypothetical protein